MPADETPTLTLEQRLERVEKQLQQLVEGLRDEIIGVATDIPTSIKWDATYVWDPDDEEDPGMGAWVVQWRTGGVSHW